MRHHYRAGFEWHDTDLDEGTALLHRLLAAAERADGADPRPFADARARRDRRRPRRADGARSARRPRRARSSRAATTPRRPRCCASSARSLGIDLDRAARRATRRERTARWHRRGPLVPSTAHDRSRSRCPTAATREYDAGATAGDDRGVDRRGPRQGGARGARSTASGATSTVRSTTTPPSRSSRPTPTTAARCCATPPRT